MNGSKRKLIFCLFLCVFTLQVKGQDIHQFHSIFLYSFSRYIEWPENRKDGDFVIAVLGESPVVNHLREMAKTKKTGNQAFLIIQYTQPEEIEYCHMLFLPESSSQWLADCRELLQNQPTLVIANSPGTATQGADINFVLVNGRPGFEMNTASTSQKNLKVAAQLLKLAIQI